MGDEGKAEDDKGDEGKAEEDMGDEGKPEDDMGDEGKPEDKGDKNKVVTQRVATARLVMAGVTKIMTKRIKT